MSCWPYGEAAAGPRLRGAVGAGLRAGEKRWKRRVEAALGGVCPRGGSVEAWWVGLSASPGFFHLPFFFLTPFPRVYPLQRSPPQVSPRCRCAGLCPLGAMAGAGAQPAPGASIAREPRVRNLRQLFTGGDVCWCVAAARISPLSV